MRRRNLWRLLSAVLLAAPALAAAEDKTTRLYRNDLTPIDDASPLLADHPKFVYPIDEAARSEAQPLVWNEGGDLSVRAWRFSMNARCVIEIPNRLRAKQTAIIVVHPWGINDGQGWRTPQPAGFAFGTPATIEFTARHLREVVNPFLKNMRKHVGAIMYSLRGAEHPIHRKLYRSIRNRPTDEERRHGRAELRAIHNAFSYRAGAIPKQFAVSKKTPVKSYFDRFPGGPHRDHYNGPGYWDLPIPVHSALTVEPNDVVFYDQDGYRVLRDFLAQQGIRHVLLCGYACTKCYRSTAAGYLNLEQDFNVFLVGDGTLEQTPMVSNIPLATSAALAAASREHLITQMSWIQFNHSPSAQIDTGVSGSKAQQTSDGRSP